MSDEVLRITVVTMAGEEREIEAPPDIPVSEFITELVSALSLPRTDAEGNAISWRLDNRDTGQTMEGEKTLGENGVRGGHRVSMIRQTVAGQ